MSQHEVMLHGFESFTTLQFRRLPRHYSAWDIVSELDQLVSGKDFDFVYVPWINDSSNNMGLAFVNFSDNSTARLVMAQLHGKCLSKGKCGGSHPLKVQPADLQGLRANLEEFKVTITKHMGSALEHVPLVFESGAQIDLGVAISTCGSADGVNESLSHQLPQSEQHQGKNQHIPEVPQWQQDFASHQLLEKPSQQQDLERQRQHQHQESWKRNCLQQETAVRFPQQSEQRYQFILLVPQRPHELVLHQPSEIPLEQQGPGRHLQHRGHTPQLESNYWQHRSHSERLKHPRELRQQQYREQHGSKQSSLRYL